MSEKFRCFGDTPVYQDYHDNEWGCPVHDDNKLFEMLTLEGAQAGLSWITVLKKREAYREGSESNPASPQRLNELVMRGKNLTFDSLPTEYKKTDIAFTVFEAAFKKATKKTLTLKEYVSFECASREF